MDGSGKGTSAVFYEQDVRQFSSSSLLPPSPYSLSSTPYFPS
jgi:hypothetical protein